MPTTKEDLRHDEHVDISVQVVSQRPASKPKRAFWFDVEDSKGNEIPVLVWEKHRKLADGISPGAQVRLNRFKVKSWPGKTTQLQTISISTVESVQPTVTRLLHVSDSHLGYQRRPESGGKMVQWSDEVNCRSRFYNVIEAAVKHDVDAVIHTGDIFDHAVSNEDLNVLEEGLRLLNSGAITFFYVLGNHEPTKGKARLRKLSDAGLAYSLEGTIKGRSVGSVNLYGLDYRTSEWWSNPDIQFIPDGSQYSVLCLHQTVSPPYSNPGPDCTLDTVLHTVASRLSPDLLLLGHLHSPISDSSAAVPAYYAGPTARISYHYKNSEPQANLFEFGEVLSRNSILL
ncbi:metallophosphoesterase [Halogeometricum sp. S1BR25-6]|uniref:Metallophosphoesterase n=1 Tax=Halogeometricum salsisoli TaxID=2950536 RepID=A0ABU2GB94_9EURY|nr:metallophosphoesterase [Halogeometricum sp. S1BR25-6]MDS0297538.1 metallophosphoesterase [Halogeometricum sp. S1BR25-6]